VRLRPVVIRGVLERATALNRRVYGYSSAKAGCYLIIRGHVPDEFDRLCVEGDDHWTEIPNDEDEP
jgi:hypothetical protein